MPDQAVSHPISHAMLEHVLATGDLSKLSTQQRLEYYARTCESVGLNPLTRPFRFLVLNGQVQLYATRDATDQLRRLHGISLKVVDKTIDSDLFAVTVRARAKDGREDEDMGAVALGQLKGESRANALMKAITKGKRRVTLSICGLGLLSEDELDTMPGARTFAADEVLPVPEQPQIPASDPLEEPNGTRWLHNFLQALDAATTPEELQRINTHPMTRKAQQNAPTLVKTQINDALTKAYDRVAAAVDRRAKRPTDPLQAALHDVEHLSLTELEEINNNAWWTSRLGELFPPDADQVWQKINARKAELTRAATQS